ncbi:MAG TPA: polyprenyl synthetase family protein [Thermoanaerobaculia bacterium]|nr:polyprenyl synthetase family protein [Thermoanaerobaculia bacterium]
MLDAFRGRLDSALSSWLGAKRQAAGRPSESGAADGLGLPEMQELIDGVARLVAGGGKRLRPALVYYTYRACGGSSDGEVWPLAMATELLHTYLLIHDDIMDHAEVRRGQPAAHARLRDLHRELGWRGDAADFGVAAAILIGDLAHSYAVELFTSLPLAERDDRSQRAEGADRADRSHAGRALTRSFSAMCEEVIGGQYLELLLAQAAVEPEARELLRVLRLKSGRYTAERPIQLGAILAGASAEAKAELSLYGTAVGEAFQLQDDLLGMFGDAAATGKPVDADLKEGKFTFLIHHALAAASPAERQALAAALGNPAATPEQVMRARAVLERTGARRAVTEMAAERLRAARESLGALALLGLAEEGRLFFAGLLDYLRERER